MRLVAANERKDTGLRIEEVVKEGQAAKTRLIFANDLVTHVNGVDVQQMALVKIRKLIMSEDTFDLTLFGLRDKDGNRYESSSSCSGATCKVCKQAVSKLPQGLDDWRCDSCGTDDLYPTDPMFACATMDKCDYGICIKCFQKHGGAGASDAKSKP